MSNGSESPLRVLQTVPTTRADYGGPSRSVPFLCEGLARHGASVRLVTTVPGGNDKATSVIPENPVHTHAAEERTGLRTAIDFYQVLRAQIEESRPQLIHDHGLWLPQNALSAVAAWRSGVPFVVTPRGMLEPWALQHRRWKKRIAWWGYQRWLLKQAILLHATAHAEAESLRRLGLDQPIAVVPNGVELPDAEQLRGASDSGGYQALFLSRVHPKKGLPMLLEAWADVQPDEWELLLVGPSEEGHREKLRATVRQRGLEDAVTFVGPVDDDEKWSYYASADLFVLPTHSENFGIVVAEALAAAVPVLTTTGAPWEDLDTHECGWWVEPDAGAITEALRRAIQSDDAARRAMGKRGRALIEEKYSWESVASQMKAAYRWLLGEGTRPECIRLD